MRRLLVCATITLVAGCASFESTDGPPTRDRPTTPSTRTPGPEPLSRYGNPAFYEVDGKRYYVKDSAKGYKARGIASWYGTKFHGKRTSSGETYDMHAMTAAHKTLPLPTWVQVTNVATGKSLVLRVNDRGPFVGDRIIDLSYAAAQALGIAEAGTGLVDIEALDFSPPQDTASLATSGGLYLQAGAFGDRSNAERRLSELDRLGIRNAFIVTDSGEAPSLHRVRVGPLAGPEQFDALSRQLNQNGIRDVRLVTD